MEVFRTFNLSFCACLLSFLWFSKADTAIGYSLPGVQNLPFSSSFCLSLLPTRELLLLLAQSLPRSDYKSLICRIWAPTFRHNQQSLSLNVKLCHCCMKTRFEGKVTRLR